MQDHTDYLSIDSLKIGEEMDHLDFTIEIVFCVGIIGMSFYELYCTIKGYKR